MSAEQSGHDPLLVLVRELEAAADGAPMVLLMSVNDGAVVAIAPAGRASAAAIHNLRFGSLSSASSLLKHDPPTPIELEQAIEVIEEAVMPLTRKMIEGAVLVVSSPALERLWRPLAPECSEVASLSIDQVEALFNGLAAVAEGRPTVSNALPVGTAFAWQLLVLREAMHYWGFTLARLVG